MLSLPTKMMTVPCAPPAPALPLGQWARGCHPAKLRNIADTAVGMEGKNGTSDIWSDGLTSLFGGIRKFWIDENRTCLFFYITNEIL